MEAGVGVSDTDGVAAQRGEVGEQVWEVVGGVALGGGFGADLGVSAATRAGGGRARVLGAPGSLVAEEQPHQTLAQGCRLSLAL